MKWSTPSPFDSVMATTNTPATLRTLHPLLLSNDAPLLRRHPKRCACCTRRRRSTAVSCCTSSASRSRDYDGHTTWRASPRASARLCVPGGCSCRCCYECAPGWGIPREFPSPGAAGRWRRPLSPAMSEDRQPHPRVHTLLILPSSSSSSSAHVCIALLAEPFWGSLRVFWLFLRGVPDRIEAWVFQCFLPRAVWRA